ERLQTDLTAGAAEIERLGSLTKDLEAIRAERDQLRGERPAVARKARRLQERLDELERSLAETTAKRDDLARAHQEATGRWEAERLQEEVAGIRQERDRLVEERAAADRQFAVERESWQVEGERLRAEAAALREDQEAALGQINSLHQDCDRLAAARQDVEQRHQ